MGATAVQQRSMGMCSPSSLEMEPWLVGCIFQWKVTVTSPKVAQDTPLEVSLYFAHTFANNQFIKLYTNYPLGMHYLIPART